MDSSLLVWAKLRFNSFWPAIILKTPPKELEGKGNPEQICVLFFGTKKYAFVDSDKILNYTQHREKLSKKKTRGLANAVARCDEFLADPKKYAENVNMGLEECTLQTQLPFTIKTEPKDDGDTFCQQETIKIDPAKLESNNKPNQEASNSEDYEKRISHLENKYRELSEQTVGLNDEIHRLKEQFENTPVIDLRAVIADLRDQLAKKNSQCVAQSVASDEKVHLISEKYEMILQRSSQQKEVIKELNNQVKEKNSAYESVLADKGKSEQSWIEKHSREVLDLNKKLQETSEQRNKVESSIKLTIDGHLEKIKELEAKLPVKDSLYASLEVDKKAVEDDLQKQALQIAEMKKNYDEMVSVKENAESQMKDSAEKHEQNIEDLKIKLNEKNTLYETLLADKQQSENKIEQSWTEKHSREVLDLNKKLQESSEQRNKSESSMKMTIDGHLEKIKELEAILTVKDSLYASLEVDKKAVEDDLQKQAFQIAEMKKKIDEMSKNYDEMVSAKENAESQMTDSAEKYEQNIEDLKIKLNEKNTLYETLLADKQQSENKIEQSWTEKHSREVLDLNKKLQESSEQRNKSESSMKLTIDGHLEKIKELEAKLTVKDSLYASLEVDKKAVEDDLQKQAFQIAEMKKEIDEMSKKYDEMISVKDGAVSQVKDPQASEKGDEKVSSATTAQSLEEFVRPPRRSATIDALNRITPSTSGKRPDSAAKPKDTYAKHKLEFKDTPKFKKEKKTMK